MNPAIEHAKQMLDLARHSYGRFIADAQHAMDALERVGARLAIPTVENIRVQTIINVVAADYQLNPALLVAPGRLATIAEARHVAMALCSEILCLSNHEVGNAFRRDHGAVFRAVRNIPNWCATDSKFKARFARIRTATASALVRPKAA